MCRAFGAHFFGPPCTCVCVYYRRAVVGWWDCDAPWLTRQMSWVSVWSGTRTDRRLITSVTCSESSRLYFILQTYVSVNLYCKTNNIEYYWIITVNSIILTIQTVSINGPPRPVLGMFEVFGRTGPQNLRGPQFWTLQKLTCQVYLLTLFANSLKLPPDVRF